MKIASMIDQHLPVPHGNRQGLSYGELAVLLLTYIVSEADHRICCVEKWVCEHHRSLEEISGWKIAEKEATDDRCGDLLRTMGQPERISQMSRSISKYLVKAYELPTEKARSDTTSFSVYHQISENEDKSSLIQFGYSKDHRPDLKQYRQMLATCLPIRNAIVRSDIGGKWNR